MDTWDCGKAPLDLEALKGRPCYGGLDMSTNTDLSALVLVFPQPEGVGYDVLAYAWCPETGIRRRSQRDHAPYDLWARDRHLLVTAGDAVDQEAIRQKILELRAVYDIREIGYDDWNMGYLAPKLMADGLTLVPLRQTFKALSGATKHLERCVLKGELRHGGHPVLRWCIANTVVDTDGPENVKPSKKRSPERIDLTVALVMALERVLRNDQPAWTGAALVL
jgi:phage terminase large subunit-like protein